jgi:cystathionine beta-lyase
VKEHLPAIKINRSESTYLMWLDTRLLNLPMDQLQERLNHIGKVTIMDGRIYGGNGEYFLRLNVGCQKKNYLTA